MAKPDLKRMAAAIGWSNAHSLQDMGHGYLNRPFGSTVSMQEIACSFTDIENGDAGHYLWMALRDPLDVSGTRFHGRSIAHGDNGRLYVHGNNWNCPDGATLCITDYYGNGLWYSPLRKDGTNRWSTVNTVGNQFVNYSRPLMVAIKVAGSP